MKKTLALLLAALFLLGAGCSRDMNWVISNEPCVHGIVEQIESELVGLRVTKSDDPALAPGSLVYAEKATRLNDCKFSAQVGDEVAVYYDSGTPVSRDEIPAIRDVHGYCLVVPIEREGEK